MGSAQLVEIFLCTLGVLALVPASVLILQAAMAFTAEASSPPSNARRPNVAVLIPAHDEASGIGRTLACIQGALEPGDRVLVVADNCTDETADIAAAAGVVLIERRDPARRGKGYALACGVRHLENAAPEVVIVVDADCEVQAGAIERLARLCVAMDRPVQALYEMCSPPTAGPLTRLAHFAWLVKNHVRPLGYHRLGLPCQLMGTGMAFPWETIRCAALANRHLVEDLALGLELARRGKPPLFCPQARVTSSFPVSREGARVQRTRWEHGHLGVLVADTPRLLLHAARHGDGRLFAQVLDLCVPPLALFAMLVVALTAAGVAFLAAAGKALPLAFATASFLLLAAAVLVSWLGYGRRVITLSELAYAPVYALSKGSLYLKFIRHRQTDWIRSAREGK
jgi:cellulose synthase/poly-beta-1,6-N-acetylglucosamine synthase-like glycosyltransferase